MASVDVAREQLEQKRRELLEIDEQVLKTTGLTAEQFL
jgi:hypothetical protein